MTLRDLLGMITVKEAVLFSGLGVLGYHAYLLHDAIKSTAHKHVTGDDELSSSLRSEMERSEDSDEPLGFGFQGYF